MKITIIATLTDEQALILAKEKWYSQSIENIIDSSITPFLTETIQNPETPYEFLNKKSLWGYDYSRCSKTFYWSIW